MNKLKLLLSSSRPVSWINTAYPFAVGYLMAGGSVGLQFWVGTVYFLIPYNLLLYGINDVFDYESDMRNPRKGGIEGTVVAKTFHPLILWSALLLNLPFIGVLMLLGTALSNIVLVGVLFFVLAYSFKGLRFKEVPGLDSVTSSLHFVGPLLYALTLFNFPTRFWPYVAAFFFWGVASHAFGAVQDIIPDRQAGLHSVATAFGARITTRLATVFYGIACVILICQGGGSVLVGILGLLYVVNTGSMWWVNDYLRLRHQADTKESGQQEREKQWTGGAESYSLTEKNGVTNLVITFDIPPELEDYFNDTYPKALRCIKQLAEASQ